MPPRILTYNMLDFTGGLNLEPDQFKLAPNECPEMLNVDISPRGGISHRFGFESWRAAASSSDLVEAHTWMNHPVSPCVLARQADGVFAEYRAGSTTTWTSKFPAASPATSTFWGENRVSAEFKQDLYLAGNYSVLQLDEATGVTEWDDAMADADYNADLDTPTADQFPAACAVAAWQGSMWAANITEGDTPANFPNRVRWSHPNQPNDWHPNHYFDIEEDDGGEIIALVPDGDRLLIMRERSIHAVVGAPPEQISVYEVSDVLGITDARKVVQTPFGVYFWSDDRGVYRIGQQSLEWVFEKLYPGMLERRLRGDDAVLSWGGDRLYVAVDFLNRDLTETFQSWMVYDPAVGKSGAWVRHAFTSSPSITLPSSVWFDPSGSDSVFLVVTPDALLRRSTSSYTDAEVFGVSAPSNTADFRTAWIDLGQPGQLKRFRRADVFGSGLNDDQQLDLEVFTDYDSVTRRRMGEIILSRPSSDAAWDDADWDVDDWAVPSIRNPVRDRTAPLGRARSVQLRFQDTADPFGLDWRLDSLVIKYTPYRVRG